ncbi:MAG: site-specific DNA-methyltransferase [Planctomycetaceae bacterium]|jgi:adenine-specific DNA-methyltransferase|nr:site-specific DNA-methyltransferase [Planctomycetaceae bacterium]
MTKPPKTQQNNNRNKNHKAGLKEIIEHNNSIQPNNDLLETLKIAIPQFFDQDGIFKRDKFDEELNEKNATESRDGYKLNFIGKDYARLQTSRHSATMITPDTKHNSKTENKNSKNIFITGDNLEALRHLQNAYAGKIKMIYIDPPYNTGKEFTYNDTFEFNDEQLKSALGYNDYEIARLKSLQEKSSHSAWLTFMYPRLKLAQKLLSNDGVIFVSIDDNEQANLKLLLDDVFGEGNFVATIIWQKKFSPQNDATYFSNMHDFILCYAKKAKQSKDDTGFDRILLTRDKIPDNYSNPDNDPKGLWSSGDFTAEGPTENCIYEIIAPNGTRHIPPIGKRWVYNKENYERLRIENRFWFGRNGDAFPRLKRYWCEVQQGMVPNTIWFYEDVGHTQEAKQETNKLFASPVFDFPKPVRLIEYILKIASKESDIILDFFAGSGTTAHAVMQLNAEDGGDRQFIMVQLDESVPVDSEARKAGYETIDAIARERIKRAAAKIRGDKGLALSEKFDGGFKHYRLVTPEVKLLDKISEFDPSDKLLFASDMLEPFSYKQSGTSGIDTLLTTWLIDDGYQFDVTILTKKFDDYTAYYAEDSATLYLLQPNFNTTALKELLNQIGKNELTVNTIIIYIYSFDFETMHELKSNIKNNLDNPPTIICRG